MAPYPNSSKIDEYNLESAASSLGTLREESRIGQCADRHTLGKMGYHPFDTALPATENTFESCPWENPAELFVEGQVHQDVALHTAPETWT